MRYNFRVASCSITDCDQSVFARGWCVKHYHRWYGATAMRKATSLATVMSKFVVPLRSHIVHDPILSEGKEMWLIYAADRPRGESPIGRLYRERTGRWSYSHRDSPRNARHKGLRAFSNRELALSGLAHDEFDWRRKQERAIDE